MDIIFSLSRRPPNLFRSVSPRVQTPVTCRGDGRVCGFSFGGFRPGGARLSFFLASFPCVKHWIGCDSVGMVIFFLDLLLMATSRPPVLSAKSIDNRTLPMDGLLFPN
jgi:hypothetical protein